MAEFSIRFRTLVTDSGRNDEVHQRVFIKGLNDQVKDEIALCDDLSGLDSLISLATGSGRDAGRGPAVLP